MTDKDFVKTLVGEVMTTHDAESIIKGIEILEAENASLRERLDKAIILPCKECSKLKTLPCVRGWIRRLYCRAK